MAEQKSTNQLIIFSNPVDLVQPFQPLKDNAYLSVVKMVGNMYALGNGSITGQLKKIANKSTGNVEVNCKVYTSKNNKIVIETGHTAELIWVKDEYSNEEYWYLIADDGCYID